MMYRSFVDLVFIILCALAVMLDQSIAVRGLRADPADVGNGGTEEIALEDMEVLVVGEEAFGLGGEEYADAGSAVAAAGPDAPIVVVPESDSVSHHRVVETWWDIRRTGRHVELGVRASGEGEGS